jgi:hypothetical protein
MVGQSRADMLHGTVYYTHYDGGENVWSVDYSYNTVSHALSFTNNTGIAAVNGADGIIFSTNGNLLIGGQTFNQVHEITTAGAPVVDVSAVNNSYHLALHPSGNTVYTSTFEGSLVSIPLAAGVLAGPGTAHALGGGDNGITSLAFDSHGNAFYVNGNPNGFGNVGTIDLSTFTTTRLDSNVHAAHGMVYDPYTGLMTMFGNGYTATLDPSTHALLESPGSFAGDFDQGAVDGEGHAFVAGAGGITFIDYATSHDITHPDYYMYTGGFGSIDDVAPLVGLGSQTGAAPVPPTAMLLATGIMSLAGYRWRLRRKVA